VKVLGQLNNTVNSPAHARPWCAELFAD